MQIIGKILAQSFFLNKTKSSNFISSQFENDKIIEIMLNFFPLLNELSLFVNRCYLILKNIFNQLFFFFNLR